MSLNRYPSRRSRSSYISLSSIRRYSSSWRRHLCIAHLEMAHAHPLCVPEVAISHILDAILPESTAGLGQVSQHNYGLLAPVADLPVVRPCIAPNLGEEDDILAALKHPPRNRSHHIRLDAGKIKHLRGRIVPRAAVSSPSFFPSWTYGPPKFIFGRIEWHALQVAPHPLGEHPLPVFPQLLLSSRDLVSLSLGSGFLLDKEFPSPEVLTAALSAAMHLQHLAIHADFEMFPSEQESPHPPPLDLITFSTLVKFDFKGSTEYLQDFVSRIDAPHLKQLFISFFRQEAIDIPQLSLFISHTQELSSLPMLLSRPLNPATKSCPVLSRHATGHPLSHPPQVRHESCSNYPGRPKATLRSITDCLPLSGQHRQGLPLDPSSYIRWPV